MPDDPLAQVKAAALSDINFRRQIIANPSQALQSMGVQPTQQLLTTLQTVLKDLEALAQLLAVDVEEFFT